MASYTAFLNLEKPTTSERLDVLKINANWDKIDAGVSALNSQKMTGSVQDFYQSNVAHTITFDGSATSRAFAGFIAICGQSGMAEYVPFGLIGSNIGVQGAITAVAVASNSLNITTSGKVISIPASIQGGWGTISVVMFRNEPNLTITFA